MTLFRAIEPLNMLRYPSPPWRARLAAQFGQAPEPLPKSSGYAPTISGS